MLGLVDLLLISPSFLIADGPVIQKILQHLTSRRTVPNVLLNYEPLGGSDEITLLHAEGSLKTLFRDAGVTVRNVRP